MSSPVIGILMLDTKFPRIVGDIGNPQTFHFPVLYKIVSDADPKRVVEIADASLLAPFIAGARELEAAGVKAIFTSCGFLAMFQKELAEALSIPVYTSSLLQIPFIQAVLPTHKKIGIITANAAALKSKHLKAVGAENTSLVIYGLENSKTFRETFLENGTFFHKKIVEEEIAAAAKKMKHEHTDIGAVILECTNLPPYTETVKHIMQVPVFSIVTLANYVYLSI